MKKALSMILALAMVLTCVGSFAEGFTPAATYDVGERTYDAGSVTTAPAVDGGGSVTEDVYAGIAGKDYTDEAVYTYSDYSAGIGSSMNWDPLSWETNDDDALSQWLVSGLYTFVPNSDLSGYSVIPDMAAAQPVDVTDQYVGSYGVAEGETGKAWRIALRTDLCFDDGTPITADTFVYSMQQQLNPKMLNRRADSWYAGDFVIVNAKNYLYAGGTVYNNATGTESAEELYVDMWNFYGLEGAVDEAGNECPQYVSALDETKYQDPADGSWISAAEIYADYFAPGAAYESYVTEYCAVAATAESVTWDDVGFKKIDDYTIDFIVTDSVAQPAFYVPYYLTAYPLVEESVYEACKTFYDADGKVVSTEEEASSVTTNYCRTLATTVSYGPYKLSSFELDKEYTLVRNDAWYGYHDGQHLGQYQTDVIVVNVIAEQATALLAFEKGEIDAVSLQSQDMDKYASSDYIIYEPQTYTTKFSFNTDYAKLVEHGTNSQVVVIDEFREAFANALDRNAFATAYTAAGTAGYGMLNNLYCYDPFTGSLYRDSDAAKEALCEIYGITWGEGNDYDTLDEAYAAITGYDMAKAQALMQTAYDKAVAAGIYDGESAVELEVQVYSDDTVYVQMINYLNAQLAEAVKGTGFEGKVSIKMTVNADYYDAMYNGQPDAIFTTWGGAVMNPFGLLYECYCDASDGSGNQMEYGFDTSAISVTITVDGTAVTDTLQNWAMWLDNMPAETLNAAIGSYNDYDNTTKCAFFAALEKAYLAWYVTTPIYYRNVASLHSQKVNYASYDYNSITGFGGGIQFATYNYTDEEWAAYIAAGTLEY